MAFHEPRKAASFLLKSFRAWRHAACYLLAAARSVNRSRAHRTEPASRLRLENRMLRPTSIFALTVNITPDGRSQHGRGRPCPRRRKRKPSCPRSSLSALTHGSPEHEGIKTN